MMRVPLAFMLLLASVEVAEPVWVTLTPDQVQEAIAHGRTTFDRYRAEQIAVDNLDPEYVVDLPGIGRAMLFTEFSSVALETRRWRAIGGQLDAAAVESILATMRDRLVFSVVVVLRSGRESLRHYTVRLVQGSTSRAPANWDVYRTSVDPAVRERFVAPAQYTFLTKDVDVSAPATLVLSAQDGHEIRFEFPLGTLR